MREYFGFEIAVFIENASLPSNSFCTKITFHTDKKIVMYLRKYGKSANLRPASTVFFRILLKASNEKNEQKRKANCYINFNNLP